MGVSLVSIAQPATAQVHREWCPEPEARQFDFWLGEWDVRNQVRRPGDPESPWYDSGTATNRVYAVVGGCALVEHWRGYAIPGAGHIAGFSVRAWDPREHRWDLVLLWPTGGTPSFGTPSGRFRGGRGDFFNRFLNARGDSVVSRLSFFDVTDDAFVWTNGVSTDGGESWASTWRMEQSRRPPTATGVLNGPGTSTARCPGEPHRAFDRFLGEWRGVRVGADGDSVPVHTRQDRILDGCAVMETTRADDGSWEAFRVRAWVPAEERWVEYGIASDRRGLGRRDGPGSPGAGDALSFTEVAPRDGTVRRLRWAERGGAFGWIEEEADAVGGPWRLRAETVFEADVGVRSGG